MISPFWHRTLYVPILYVGLAKVTVVSLAAFVIVIVRYGFSARFAGFEVHGTLLLPKLPIGASDQFRSRHPAVNFPAINTLAADALWRIVHHAAETADAFAKKTLEHNHLI